MFICMTILLMETAMADGYQLNVPVGMKGNNHILNNFYFFLSFTKSNIMKQLVLFTFWMSKM